MFFALFGSPTPAIAAELPVPIFASSTAESIILAEAIHYGVNGNDLLKTLQCESGLNENAQGDYSSTTKSYTSFGIAQIHLSAHQEVTKKEALDPMWSIGWAAYQFSVGNADLWTCHRELKNER